MAGFLVKLVAGKALGKLKNKMKKQILGDKGKPKKSAAGDSAGSEMAPTQMPTKRAGGGSGEVATIAIKPVGKKRDDDDDDELL